MKLYQITAQIVRCRDSWRASEGVPMFYLRDDIQCIPNEQAAERVARTMFATLANDSSIEAIHIGVSVSRDFDPAVLGA